MVYNYQYDDYCFILKINKLYVINYCSMYDYQLRYFSVNYYRLTPCVVLTLAVFVVIVHTGAGPLWNIATDLPMEMCNSNWWRTFLYIANWWELEEMARISLNRYFSFSCNPIHVRIACISGI